MFVQLRRVVYLLVLLQCCVCVVNASDAGDVSQKMERLIELQHKVDDLKVKAESCSEGLQVRAVSSKENDSTLTTAVEDATKRIDEFWAMELGSQAEKELRDRAWVAAQKAKDAAKKAKTVVNETTANIIYCMREAGNLLSRTYDLEDAIKEYLKMVGERKEKYQEKGAHEGSVDGGRQTAEKLTNVIEEAKDAVKKVKDQLKSQEKSLEKVDRFLQNEDNRPMTLPAEEQPPSATENRNSSSEKGNEQSVVAGPKGTGESQNNTHTNGMRETTENNTANSQVHQNPEENVMDNVNTSNGSKITGGGERDVGVQNTNENPQKHQLPHQVLSIRDRVE